MSLLSMKSACQVTTPAVRALREETERLADAADDLDLSGLSEGLRHLIGAGEWEGGEIGPPQVSMFDTEDGDRVAGAFSDKYATQLVREFAEFLKTKNDKGVDPARFRQAVFDADDYFRRVFGQRFKKTLSELAAELNRALDAAKKKGSTASRGFTTGTLTTMQPTTTTTNLVILQKVGGLP